MDFPIFLKLGKSETYFCVDSEYKFIRYQKDTNRHGTIWSMQFGLHFSKQYDKKDEGNFYLKQLVKNNNELNKEEFIDKICGFEEGLKIYMESFSENFIPEENINFSEGIDPDDYIEDDRNPNFQVKMKLEDKKDNTPF